MKTGVYSTLLALWLLCIANVYAVNEADGAAELTMQHEESTPYSYFLESELDDTYERGDGGSVYEIPDDATLTTMSLLDLAGAPDLLDSADGEFDDESDFSFLEEGDEENETEEASFLEIPEDDEFDFDASFMEAEEDDNPADALSSGIDEEFGEMEAKESDILDTEATSYMPIRRRTAVRNCNDHRNHYVERAVDDVLNTKAAMLQQGEIREPSTWGSFFKSNGIIIGLVLLVASGLGVWLVMYTPACVIVAKERVIGYFNRESDRNTVLPEVTESEPLMAQ
ncbi:RNA polymerase beta subunit [Babesia ovata]|uniref:RNA polymerase beta subunit n=1 Tax=Babesia ovata TaxID=189622 RepID=A0A2H6KE52_9APIC|nr:RNA polymerase beta subunit [Babesia ovata]GBE61239.1 RNA polymerase beta subunit [Babesia ovata]